MNVAGHLEWVSLCWGGHAQDADICLGGEHTLLDALLVHEDGSVAALMYDKGVGRMAKAVYDRNGSLVCEYRGVYVCGIEALTVFNTDANRAGPHKKVGGELSAWELVESAAVARARVFVEHLVKRVGSALHTTKEPQLSAPSMRHARMC